MEPKYRPFLVQQRTTMNQKPNLMSLLFFAALKVCTKTIKKS